jgi:GNAT superfamily N-acetyltransferase
MTDVDIRLLKQDDYSLIIEIESENEAMHRAFLDIATSVYGGFDDVSYTYGAFFDEFLCGFIYGFVLPNKLLLPQYLYVLPAYRKQGIGQRLLETFESESGCSSSLVYFEKSLSLYYKKLGYVIGDAVVALKEFEP